MTGYPVATQGLTISYGSTRAIDDFTVTFAANQIHGVFGRNGAGKTTLLSAIAAFLPVNNGELHVDGRVPFENGALSRDICLIRESGDFLRDERVRTNLKWLADTRPHFDTTYAEELADRFELNPATKLRNLSRGQRSSFGALAGLASRTPVTMFDEVHLGMDASNRQTFYTALLADFAEHPRTILLSSHLISEVESFIETVTIIHAGSLLLHGTSDEVRTRGVTLTGPDAALEPYLAGHTIIGTANLGPTRQVTLYGELDDELLARASADGISVAGVGLQELFIHLTEVSA